MVRVQHSEAAVAVVLVEMKISSETQVVARGLGRVAGRMTV